MVQYLVYIIFFAGQGGREDCQTNPLIVSYVGGMWYPSASISDGYHISTNYGLMIGASLEGEVDYPSCWLVVLLDIVKLPNLREGVVVAESSLAVLISLSSMILHCPIPPEHNNQSSIVCISIIMAHHSPRYIDSHST